MNEGQRCSPSIFCIDDRNICTPYVCEVSAYVCMCMLVMPDSISQEQRLGRWTDLICCMWVYHIEYKNPNLLVGCQSSFDVKRGEVIRTF